MVGRTYRGFLLVEALLAMAVLMVVLMILMPTIQRFEHDSTQRQFTLAAIDRQQLIQDQFQAQFARLGQFGCYDGERTLTIGDGLVVPDSMRRKKWDTASDWLYATDLGLCSVYGANNEQVVSASLECDGLSVGDRIRLSNCAVEELSNVLSYKQNELTALSQANALNGDVLIQTQQEFYWYVAPGKNSLKAFWRKPSPTGNGLELLSNIEHVRMYPILDRNQDGVAEELVREYGPFKLRQLRGLLIEFMFVMPDCKAEKVISKTYDSLRGDTWTVDGVCRHIGKQIVTMGRDA